MIITINDVAVEQVRTGKTPYEKAVVSYTYQGAGRKQTLLSFSNPAVFKQVKAMQAGESYDVTITKNDQGYNTWAAVKAATAEAPAAGKPASVSVPKSNYETPEERKLRQLYIIRQSSIANALEYFSQTRKDGEFGVSDVTDIAQMFVDFVYAPVETSDLFEQDNDLPE